MCEPDLALEDSLADSGMEIAMGGASAHQRTGSARQVAADVILAAQSDGPPVILHCPSNLWLAP